MGFNASLKSSQAAAQYLEMRGFEIIELNFRRSKFRIDIIAKNKGIICFVFVRLIDFAAAPSDWTTSSQLVHMKLAAARWIEENEYLGPINYDSIEMDTDSQSIISFSEGFI
jgi:Holliday junction resolvase-like predicted endonuclease